MADPLTALGAASSIVQIADVALHLSREAYSFLSAVKDAKKDIQAVRESLRDADSNVRNLRNYVEEYRTTKNACNTYENLPAAVIEAVRSFHSDVNLLRDILPGGLNVTTAAKFKWAFDKRRLREINRRLECRKVDISLALMTVGRFQDLRAERDMGDLQDIMNQAKGDLLDQHRLSRASTSDAFSAILEQNRTNHDTYISKLATIGLSSSNMITNLHQEVDESRRTLKVVHADITTLLSNRTVTAVKSDELARVVRAELQRVLKPIVESGFTKSDMRNDRALRQMHQMVDNTSIELGERTASDNIFTDRSALSQIEATDLLSEDEDSLNSTVIQDSPSISTYTCELSRPTLSRTYRNYRRSWRWDWQIGTVYVEIEHVIQRTGYPLQHQRGSEIRVSFRPRQGYFSIPGLSLRYSNMPSQDGYYNLTPQISTLPIISKDHPVWHAVRKGDIDQLRELFVQGLASPRCQNEDGLTLLHYAAAARETVMYKYLLSLGVDPHSRTLQGGDACILLYFIAIDPYFLGRYRSVRPKGNHSDEALVFWQLIEDSGDEVLEVYDRILESSLRWDLYSIHVNGLASLASLFRSKGMNLWNFIDRTVNPPPTVPCSASLRSLEMMLEAGFDPNFLGGPSKRPMIIRALGEIMQNKKQPETQDPEVSIWCILETLIRAGADIYYVHKAEGATSWEQVQTPTWYAWGWGVEAEWLATLQACGYHPGEVYKEDERRCREYVKLHGAKRSAVDVEDLAAPSTTGLKYRGGRRTAEL